MALSTDLTLLYRFGENAGDVGDLSPRYPGYGPTLTHSRAGPATYYDVNGLVRTAVGSDTDPLLSARNKVYDPATLESRGLLVEDETRNRCHDTEDLAASSWGKINASITTDATTSPIAGASADAVIENTATNFHGIRSNGVGSLAGQLYTISGYMKKVPGTSWSTVRFMYANFNRTEHAGISVNLDTKSITATPIVGDMTISDFEIIELNDDWVWVSMTFNIGTAVFTYYLHVMGNDFQSYAGSAGEGFYFIGGMIERDKHVATSYVKTDGADVIRPADVVSTTDVGWFNVGDNPGTFYIDAFSPNASEDAAQVLTHLDDNSLNNRWQQGVDFLSGNLRHQWQMRAINNTTQINQLAGENAQTWGDGAQHRSAWGWAAFSAPDAVAYVDGVAGAKSQSYTALPDVVSHFRIGRRENANTPLQVGYFLELRYYNTRRPDDEAYTGAGTGGLLQLSNGEVPEEEAAPVTGNPYQMLL